MRNDLQPAIFRVPESCFHYVCACISDSYYIRIFSAKTLEVFFDITFVHCINQFMVQFLPQGLLKPPGSDFQRRFCMSVLILYAISPFKIRDLFRYLIWTCPTFLTTYRQSYEKIIFYNFPLHLIFWALPSLSLHSASWPFLLWLSRKLFWAFLPLA